MVKAWGVELVVPQQGTVDFYLGSWPQLLSPIPDFGVRRRQNLFCQLQPAAAQDNCYTNERPRERKTVNLQCHTVGPVSTPAVNRLVLCLAIVFNFEDDALVPMRLSIIVTSESNVDVGTFT